MVIVIDLNMDGEGIFQKTTKEPLQKPTKTRATFDDIQKLWFGESKVFAGDIVADLVNVFRVTNGPRQLDPNGYFCTSSTFNKEKLDEVLELKEALVLDHANRGRQAGVECPTMTAAERYEELDFLLLSNLPDKLIDIYSIQAFPDGKIKWVQGRKVINGQSLNIGAHSAFDFKPFVTSKKENWGHQKSLCISST